MSRPKRERSVRCLPEVTHFEPRGVSAGAADAVELSLDELEALRLADLQGRAQADAAERMGVSRATFGRVVASARCKVASALVQGRAIRIAGGPVTVHQHPRGSRMKFAIASNPHDIVARHFGKSARFVVYTLEDGKVVAEEARTNPHLGRPHQGPPRGHAGVDGPVLLRGDGHGHGQGDGRGHRHRHGQSDCDDYGDGHRPGRGFGDGEGHGWIADVIGDCEAVITAGIGSGAVTQLNRAGIRLVLLDRPTPLADAVALYAEGRL
jgi:predicted DNA-binding protein (UPF0251 family)/predicted Fe-Mo cluster-binding NifX family protein